MSTPNATAIASTRPHSLELQTPLVSGLGLHVKSVTSATALGHGAGYSSQSSFSVAIGALAGSVSQASNSVAIGKYAGLASQQHGCVAIGALAGSNTQGLQSIAIGLSAGEISLSTNAIAIGRSAGVLGLGLHSVAIGAFAGSSDSLTSNTIFINATGSPLTATTLSTSTVYIKPIHTGSEADSKLEIALTPRFRVLVWDSITGMISAATSLTMVAP